MQRAVAYSRQLTDEFHAFDGQYLSRCDGRMEEESESDAFAWNKGGNVRRRAQGDLHGQSWSGGSACHLEHEGDAAAKAAIDLNDPEAVRRELDLRVKAADLDAHGEHRGGRKIQNPVLWSA